MQPLNYTTGPVCSTEATSPHHVQTTSTSPLLIKSEPDHTPKLLVELIRSEPDQAQLQAKVASYVHSPLGGVPNDLFSMICKLADQTLFAFVDWARNSVFFKELKVEDQMKLLQSSWSELLLLDHLYRQASYNGEHILLITGQTIDPNTLPLREMGDVVEQLNRLVMRMRELKLDYKDFVCLKFLILLNPGKPLQPNPIHHASSMTF
ncbi:putative nuclear receptor subfamily 5 group A member 2 isoform X3 [Apostichopus japonicus]|uniref:Putative nuclear receptor subfamily 5 group A member 2 isoform X3 n=1 Tax=Stichopus japonicus TaxID=307972 RepID=A0A2G8KM63_STIJA|nr:putative nuclear receptor subfamily 5 group A member 2 isoform X3 [Apostichopus japonicus]